MKFKVGDIVDLKVPAKIAEVTNKGYIIRPVVETSINPDFLGSQLQHHNTKPEYPKEMYVWDNDKTFEERQTVLAYLPELDTPYLVRSMLQNDRFMGFKHARDVPQQTELSMQEIADKFNIDVKQLKIKK